MVFSASGRAGDWSVDKQVDGATLSGTAGLLLAGEDVVVTGFGRAWLLDGATGETLATCLDVFPSQSSETRYLVTTDLLLALRGEDHMLFGLRTGAPMSAPASASFAVSHDALFSVSGDERPCAARIEPTGRTGWVKDVPAAFALDTITASKHGVVLSGPEGFVELDPAGKELRTWRVPEAERAALRVEACRTQVVDDLVLVSLQLDDGEGKLRVFKGKRPRELSLRGQATPGVVTLGGEPLVIRRGSKEWVLVELALDAPDGARRYVAVDLSRASAGPEVVAQRSAIARTGRALRGGEVVDLVTGETSPGPAGDGWSVAHTLCYRSEGSTLHYRDLEGGEPKSVPLPPAATLTPAPLADVLFFSAGGGAAPTTVGTVDLRRARVDVLETLGPAHDLQVGGCVSTGKAAFFLLRLREGASGPERLRVVRRAR
jgi:hypothetical protein